MKIILQVHYPVALLTKEVDSKIRKIFKENIQDPNYETASGAGFGVRELEASCDKKFITADVIQTIEDSVTNVFDALDSELKYEYNSVRYTTTLDDPDYRRYRVVSFTFKA